MLYIVRQLIILAQVAAPADHRQVHQVLVGILKVIIKRISLHRQVGISVIVTKTISRLRQAGISGVVAMLTISLHHQAGILTPINQTNQVADQSIVVHIMVQVIEVRIKAQIIALRTQIDNILSKK